MPGLAQHTRVRDPVLEKLQHTLVADGIEIASKALLSAGSRAGDPGWRGWPGIVSRLGGFDAWMLFVRESVTGVGGTSVGGTWMLFVRESVTGVGGTSVGGTSVGRGAVRLLGHAPSAQIVRCVPAGTEAQRTCP